MNLIDLFVILVFVFCIVFAMYRGFLNSVMKAGASLVSMIAAFILHPVLSWILGGQGMIKPLINYTEGAKKLADASMSSVPVSGMTHEALANLVDTSTLMTPFNRLVKGNLMGESFAGRGLTTVGQYFDHTVAEASLNILCFLILFLIIRITLGVLINIMDYQTPFPVLIRNDTLFAALSGFAQAFILCYVIFFITPVVLSVFNMTAIVDYFNGSFFGSFFYKTNLFFLLIGGR